MMVLHASPLNRYVLPKKNQLDRAERFPPLPFNADVGPRNQGPAPHPSPLMADGLDAVRCRSPVCGASTVTWIDRNSAVEGAPVACGRRGQRRAVLCFVIVAGHAFSRAFTWPYFSVWASCWVWHGETVKRPAFAVHGGTPNPFSNWCNGRARLGIPRSARRRGGAR